MCWVWDRSTSKHVERRSSSQQNVMLGLLTFHTLVVRKIIQITWILQCHSASCSWPPSKPQSLFAWHCAWLRTKRRRIITSRPSMQTRVSVHTQFKWGFSLCSRNNATTSPTLLHRWYCRHNSFPNKHTSFSYTYTRTHTHTYDEANWLSILFHLYVVLRELTYLVDIVLSFCLDYEESAAFNRLCICSNCEYRYAWRLLRKSDNVQRFYLCTTLQLGMTSGKHSLLNIVSKCVRHTIIPFLQ